MWTCSVSVLQFHRRASRSNVSRPVRTWNVGPTESDAVTLRQNAQALGTAWRPWRISSTLRRVASFVSGSCLDPELIIRQQGGKRILILVWLPVTEYHFQLWSLFVAVVYRRSGLSGIPRACRFLQHLCSDERHKICQSLHSGCGENGTA